MNSSLLIKIFSLFNKKNNNNDHKIGIAKLCVQKEFFEQMVFRAFSSNMKVKRDDDELIVLQLLHED